MNKKATLLWLILGLGSSLQLVASMSITELLVLIIAPMVVVKDFPAMKRDGVAPFFWLAILVVVGCVVASIVNHTPGIFILRGMAVTCLISSSIIVSHWLIRKDPSGFKWFIVGGAISLILCTFIFKRSVEIAMTGESSADIMGGALFLKSRINALLYVPIKGWYLHLPICFSALTSVSVVLVSLLVTVSGRGSALAGLAFMAIVLIGGRTVDTMRRFTRHFGLICCAAIMLLALINTSYRVAAEREWLGEAAKLKYERQTKGDKSIKALVLGGRMESFCGLIACVDKPIVGFGPWARDYQGYVGEFLGKYGTQEDFDAYLKRTAYHLAAGGDVWLIPAHAHVTEFWLWYGIFGLVFWLYVIFVLFRYLAQDCWAVPQWFAWLACSIPGFLWNIFFNPLSERFSAPLFVVACLMARAVRKGRLMLPLEMQEEIFKVER